MSQEASGLSDYALIQSLANPASGAVLLQALDAGLDTDPENANLLEERAALLRRLGRYEEALEAYGALLRVVGNHPYAAVMANILAGRELDDPGANDFAPAPFVRIVRPFSEADVQGFLHWALSHAADFRPAGVGQNMIKPDRRQTLVLEELGDIRQTFKGYVRDQISTLCPQFGLSHFDLSGIEVKMTNHLDGGFFNTHPDNSSRFGNEDRLISFVFYFFREPPQFEGGDLILFDTNRAARTYKPMYFTRLRCESNTMVFFPSGYFHCVEPITLTDNQFEHGRFAISGHVRPVLSEDTTRSTL